MRPAGLYKSHDLIFHGPLTSEGTSWGHPCTLDTFLVQLPFSSYHLAINIYQLSNYHLAISMSQGLSIKMNSKCKM